MNLAFGWCAITALGDYNPEKGGHLVFEELGLVVEFPPGATIFMPSAYIHHCNVPVGEHEKCTSITFYNPGSIFRYIDNKFMTENELKRRKSHLFKELQLKKMVRFSRALNLYSTLNELVLNNAI
ncbi:hypothetical protein NP233_g4402 [Leucocoprinus birnbaumii]|uniref:Uncharacterized protein n=1 Tax=Leucocoprinus birnbaumii TaxID=56174 RepID=A0AAD5YSV5_9AGAR|nr:hypothetical protein NP233_g4402 [Leucocoprinus birnbaumii]